MTEWANPWNPFNSWKLMAHAERWSRLVHQEAPPPVLVTIDPINACNLACGHCNAKAVTGLGTKLDTRLNEPLAAFLKKWGVKAVCVAGGGEPLLNPSIITSLAHADLQIGVVTNGTLLGDLRGLLARCAWVGVSVDASNPKTYQLQKGTDCFETVIENMRLLIGLMDDSDLRGDGVFYKFLILPGNEREIADAALLAWKIGCRGFHARPAGVPGIDTAAVARECKEAQALADDTFGVYTVTHKVGRDLNKHNDFRQCWGCMMTCVITPHPDGFNLDLCCDQRGDMRFRLAHGLIDPEEILAHWGGERHWAIQKSINPQDCPRCTYGPHAKLFENAIAVDSMGVNFL